MSGALVISLDFELYWGVRDHTPLDAAEKARLLVARAMVPKILDLFAEFSVHATWATVGALFTASREELEMFRPCVLPAYADTTLDPYNEHVGTSEENDPFHFAPSLIREIAKTPGQEIASHSFSHYYCLEPGQTAETFEADLESAVAIAKSSGYPVRSYVFARNQINPAYLPILHRHGIQAYRGAGSIDVYKAVNFVEQRRWGNRARRLLDTFVDVYGPQVARWPASAEPMCMEPSRYLQPCRTYLRSFDPLKVKRIVGQMRAAAQRGGIFHLWWHPEDFATGGDANLSVLRQILNEWALFKENHSMKSLNMAEVSLLKAGAVRKCEV